MRHFSQTGATLAAGLLFALTAGATSVPRVTFEELTDRSEMVVSGQIARSWAEWDSGHSYIWTHYELTVSSVHKGAPATTVTFSEPGGAVGGMRMTVADSVQYSLGDKVVVFLQRMPNGYLRTTGWAQGKYSVDSAGRLRGVAVLDRASRPIEGMTASELSARVVARVNALRFGTDTGAKQ